MVKILLLSVVAGFVMMPGAGLAEVLVGLDMRNRIFTFDSTTPGNLEFINGGAEVSGLQPNESLLGIDFRPVATNSPSAAMNGVLYSVGSSNRLYTINTATGVASQVGAAGAFTLSGTSFGMDFNPVDNLLGVVSDARQNIRLDPFGGTLAATDTSLAYASGDPGAGISPNVVGSAFTNNFGGASQTTLYGIDFSRGVLVRQGGVNGNPSPASGQLTTIGPLGANIIGEVGFDISGLSGTAYASLSTVIGPQDPSSGLYTIDLTTGAATRIGSIGAGGGVAAFVTRDIAALPGTPVPEPGVFGLLTLGFAALISRRNSLKPSPL